MSEIRCCEKGPKLITKIDDRYWIHFNYGIPTSYAVDFCPWCGAELPKVNKIAMLPPYAQIRTDDGHNVNAVELIVKLNEVIDRVNALNAKT